MKKFILNTTILLLSLFLILLIIYIFFNRMSSKKTTPKTEDWTLIWRDEFNGSKLDTTKWRIKTGSRTDELQYYSPENVLIKNGNLIIKSDKAPLSSHVFSSGWVDTVEKFSLTYGKVDIRGKLPYGKGLWPAYWLVPSSVCPPEIDIMENLGDDMYKFTSDVHWNAENNHECIEHNTSIDLSKDFHVYGIEWEPSQIRFYFDSKLIRTFNNKNNSVPSIPHVIILNTAIGGEWGGAPDKSTKFPQYNYVDYIRVWKKSN